MKEKEIEYVTLEHKDKEGKIIVKLPEKDTNSSSDYYCNLIISDENLILTYPLKYLPISDEWIADFIWDERLPEYVSDVKVSVFRY